MVKRFLCKTTFLHPHFPQKNHILGKKLTQGSVVKVKPLGIMKMMDGGEKDAVTSTLNDMTRLLGALSALPGFIDGTETTVGAALGKPQLNTGTDDYIVRVDGSEKIDLLSNGFKLRQDFSHTNTDGGTFIYVAFASSPFVSSEGVPTTAR